MKLKSLLTEALNPLDKKAVEAFFDGKPFEGKNLNSDGKTLKTVGIGSQPMYTHTPNGVKMVGKVTGGYSQSLVQYVNKVHKMDLVEAASPEAYKISRMLDTAQQTTQDFIDDNKIDVKKLESYIRNLADDEKRIIQYIIDSHRGSIDKRLSDVKKRFIKKVKESVNEGKFKKDDLVYNTRTKTVGIVRLGDDKYGEVKTDSDGNVDVDELEKYNPIKHKHQQNAKVAPSTEKEINNRGLFNPFKAESLRLKNIK